MGDMEEDRIYADRLGKTDVFVATDLGVAVVSVSNDRIGQYSLCRRCTARDVAAVGERLLVATDEDVLVADDPADGGFDPTGFGPAVAVGTADRPLAAGPDGTVARYDGDAWTILGTAGDVRAVDGDLVAAADGVYRVSGSGARGTGGSLEPVGLDDVRDVSTAGAPLAATGEGCYRLGPGWTRDLDGPFAVVAGDGRRSHAASAAHRDGAPTLYERDGDDGWVERSLPTDDPLADVGYVGDGGVVAVTTGGAFLVDPAASKDGAGGWRSRTLGLPGTAALAVPDGADERS